jgi:drug/metabolite transporter (DMT)-like permease
VDAVPGGRTPDLTSAVPDGASSRGRIAAAFAAIYLIWGSTFLAIRIGVRELPPFLFAGSRFVLAGALLGMVAAWRREPLPAGGREWRYMLIFSVLMVALSNGVSTVALQHIPSNEGALLAAGAALWIAGLGAIGPKAHALTARGILGLLLGLTGVVLIVWPRAATPSGHLAWQSLVVFGSFCWAAGTIMYRNAALPVGPVAFNAALMVLGGTWLLLAGLATGEIARWQWSPGGLAAMLYLAVFGSAVAYTAYAWLLRRVRADRVGTFAYVNPAIATVLGWAVLGEALSPVQISGMAIVLLGVALVTIPSRVA